MSHGWAELSSALSFKELVLATDFIEQGYGSHPDEGFFSYSDGDETVELKPSTLQFFYDLYGFGSSTEPVDVLVSYIDDRGQQYNRYSGLESGDVQFFFQSIHNSPAFIFQGTFSPLSKSDGSTQDVSWLRRQRSLNGICVDIDGEDFVDGKHPVDAETLEVMLETIPSGLMPSYICLTGNGVHLWYVFSSPIQTFSRNTLRQRKLRALEAGLYECYNQILEGLDAKPDMNCATLNHCFRAPGSLTKAGLPVRCFCPKERLFQASTVSPVMLSRTVAEILSPDFAEADVLTESDGVFRTRAEIERDHNAWVEQRLNTPASEAQLGFLRDLEEQGLIKEGELEGASGLSLLTAQNLINKALNRREEGGKKVGIYIDYSGWRTKSHWLVAGATGGVYNTVFQRIQEVRPGNRYNSLHMLAGVAYMMVRPEKTLASLTEDYMGLLKTSWARTGSPLTERDIKNALLGYNPDNRQTINSITRTLGFNPFDEPAKRNGRTRRDHLERVHEMRSAKSLNAIVEALRQNPEACKADVIAATGFSKHTVYKYWDEAISRVSPE